MIKVFISYACTDEKLKNKLEAHLSVLKRNNIIVTWHRKEMKAGSMFESEKNAKINDADIVLLLVSADYLDSDYCYNNEMMLAIERHERKETILVPIILRPCYWDDAPFGHLQVLPKNKKAVTLHANRDAAFTSISKNIKRLLD